MTQPHPPWRKRTARMAQVRAFEASCDADYYGLFLEQRCGKTQVVLETAAYQFLGGKIDALLVIAPNGVHRNWVTEEIPAALSDATRYRAVLWRSGRMSTAAATCELEALVKHDGLAVLAVNVDALITEKLQKYLAVWFKKRRTMSVVDESLDISANDSARSRVAARIGARSVTRRILDGTPGAAAGGPFGLYSQCKFLKFGSLGFTSYTAFKARYGVWETGRRYDPATGTQREYPVLKEYQRIDELIEKLQTFSIRITRAECADLPPKVYEKRFVELTPVQRAVYERLRSEFRVELASGTVTTAQALTRVLRLQQIVSNHVTLDAELSACANCGGDGCTVCFDYGYVGETSRVEVVDPKRDPRLEALKATVGRLRGQGIVWARFRRDIDSLVSLCNDTKLSFARYDGSIGDDERAVALQRFKSGDATLFLGNPRAGGRGLDLSAANYVIYYSHDWGLRYRLQSEDRAQSLTKTEAVLYVDLVAEDTVDEKIVTALREGRDVADRLVGDPVASWI